eukprot:15360851-Ditylum_brightwellii.AAC.1
MEQDFIEVVPPSGDEINKHSHRDHTVVLTNANTTLSEAREMKKRNKYLNSELVYACMKYYKLGCHEKNIFQLIKYFLLDTNHHIQQFCIHKGAGLKEMKKGNIAAIYAEDQLYIYLAKKDAVLTEQRGHLHKKIQNLHQMKKKCYWNYALSLLSWGMESTNHHY